MTDTSSSANNNELSIKQREESTNVSLQPKKVDVEEDDGEDINDPSSEKWSLKNYEKWKATVPVSELVGGTNIRGMKTLRHDDEDHSPAVFSQRYPNVRLIIDISKDEPPYMTNLTDFNIIYHKIGTASKIPPTDEEVQQFCDIVQEYLLRPGVPKDVEVGVHCHYGQNRTGFMICSYLIKVHKFDVQSAIAMWAKARPPGIKHQHFKDELIRRYSQK
ncbi:hypothetical protein MP228_004559 [Amoeboaphelidium protococcarum]|nr:hypothetical protein MP228_004559 [Amoeboaphelidium protococcarum]